MQGSKNVKFACQYLSDQCMFFLTQVRPWYIC